MSQDAPIANSDDAGITGMNSVEMTVQGLLPSNSFCKDCIILITDRATKATGSGSESNGDFTDFCPLESSDSVELRGLD